MKATIFDNTLIVLQGMCTVVALFIVLCMGWDTCPEGNTNEIILAGTRTLKGTFQPEPEIWLLLENPGFYQSSWITESNQNPKNETESLQTPVWLIKDRSEPD